MFENVKKSSVEMVILFGFSLALYFFFFFSESWMNQVDLEKHVEFHRNIVSFTHKFTRINISSVIAYNDHFDFMM